MTIIRSRAPLRISFAGGGTDVEPYPSMAGGAVVSTTIDRYAYVSIQSNKKKKIIIKSQDYGLFETLQNFAKINYNGKLDLAKAAIKILQKQNLYFDALLHVDAAPGSGLGSSSAMTVSLIGGLSALGKKSFSKHEIAKKAYEIERIELGIKGGKQDQYAAVFGGFNLLEFKKSTVRVIPLRIKKEILNELLASIVICDTGITRKSSHILERQAKSYEDGGKPVLKNLDYIKKSAYEMKKALLKGNMKEIGELLHVGWIHKKKLDSKISTPRIDKFYEKILKNGAKGGRLLGAGGGGHLLILCDPDRRQDIFKLIAKNNWKTVKINFDSDGLQVWKNNNDIVVT